MSHQAPTFGGNVVRLLASFLVVVVACGGTNIGPLSSPDCTINPPPQLAGQWQATLQERTLTLVLAERCEYFGGLFGGATWVVRGQWDWGGLVQGTTKFVPYYYGDRLMVFLGTDSLTPETDGVMLTLPVNVWPVPPLLSGTATGSWPRIGAPGQVWARFNNAPLTLGRR